MVPTSIVIPTKVPVDVSVEANVMIYPRNSKA
jgi:hypothetical protein